MGLQQSDAVCWDSPFDYPKQGLFYVPHHLPEPNTPEHTRAVIEAAMPVVRASGGGVFFLFTTLRAMRQAQELLLETLRREHLDYPLLAQGEGSRSALLERFRQLGNAILVGSSSFWEGVDVRGQALSVVVIDKLPFAPPDDPVLKARLDAMQRAGRNAFMEYQLPQAAIILKQGAGRLIRDEQDRGVLMICDNRLISRPYGRKLVASLPRMRRTRDEAEAVAFFDVTV
jgi:ATP-dependent DNA helicase DinG